MKYTSETIQGQVYVPAVNWARKHMIFMDKFSNNSVVLTVGIGCIVIVAAFKDLAALTNAYG
jgi:KUP system potassium uptake protein